MSDNNDDNDDRNIIKVDMRIWRKSFNRLNSSLIIQLRGLPWNSTAKDILEFLKDVQVIDEEKGVHLGKFWVLAAILLNFNSTFIQLSPQPAISHRDGRPNGEAFVELVSPDDVDKAFEYNKNIMGNRYIESEFIALSTVLCPMLGPGLCPGLGISSLSRRH